MINSIILAAESTTPIPKRFTVEDLNNIEGSIVGLRSELSGSNATIGAIVTILIPIILFAAGVALLIYLIAAGFAIMTNGGDERKLAAAKGQLTNAIIGFVIVFTAFWIVQAIALILGLDSILNVF